MPKYLAQATYTVEGMQGLFKYGGTKRREAVEELADSLGGRVEAFDLPDIVSVTTASMVVNASGASRVKMTVLLTPEEIDEASRRSVTYFPPTPG
jgi:uncharacterized protein with GYD domain